jgi:DNA-binding NarL/FixJ family response regulator
MDEHKPVGQGARPKTTSVVLVHEFPIFLEALGVVISRERDLAFVGSATTVDDAVELVQEHGPDVAVIDGDLPGSGDGSNGIETTRRIKAARPEVRILILAAQMSLDSMARAASVGACGFLSKASHVDVICEAVRTAKDGGMFVEAELIRPLVKRLQASARPQIEGGSGRAAMTKRELEVLTLLGEGLDVTSIARRLKITVNTCRGHVRRILEKLGTHSQLEAVVEAVHQGLLPHLSR